MRVVVKDIDAVDVDAAGAWVGNAKVVDLGVAGAIEIEVGVWGTGVFSAVVAEKSQPARIGIIPAMANNFWIDFSFT